MMKLRRNPSSLSYRFRCFADQDLRLILRIVNRRQYASSSGQLESYTRDYSKRGAGKKPCTAV